MGLNHTPVPVPYHSESKGTCFGPSRRSSPKYFIGIVNYVDQDGSLYKKFFYSVINSFIDQHKSSTVLNFSVILKKITSHLEFTCKSVGSTKSTILVFGRIQTKFEILKDPFTPKWSDSE